MLVSTRMIAYRVPAPAFLSVLRSSNGSTIRALPWIATICAAPVVTASR
jgi:hypothetical protein